MLTRRRTESAKTIGGYEYADLGLPSGLLWAKCNVGATKETECGNYYKYGAGATAGATDTSFYTGTETQLSTIVDTARLVMGSGWRTPTRTQYLELMDNTNVSNDYYEEFGVPGLICRSKSNPKEYVFFPISGYINPASTSDTHGGIWAWTSTPYSEQAYAFYYNGVYYPNQHVYRYYGLPVRGVHT